MNKIIRCGMLPIALFAGLNSASAIMPGAYLGLGGGISTVESKFGNYRNVDDSKFGGRAFIGYNFTNYIGIEADYTSLQKTKYQYYTFPYFSSTYSLDAVSVVGKLYLPFGDESPLNAYGLLGAGQMYGKLDRTVNSFSYVSSNNAFVPTAGVGASYDLSQRFTAGIELSGFGYSRSSADLGIPSSGLATFSLSYRL